MNGTELPDRPRGPSVPPQMLWAAAPGWSFAHRVDTVTGRVLCTGEYVTGDLDLCPNKRQCNDCLAVKGRSAL